MRAPTAIVVFIGIMNCAGCGTLPNGRGVGQDATFWPGAQRVKHAAYLAVTDRRTWIPAASAIVVNAAGWDERVSDWATQHTPIFGSPSSAYDASDHLRYATRTASELSLLATPGGENVQDVGIAKLKGYVVQSVAEWTTSEATGVLKTTVQRERPNGADTRSFPSGHTTAAFVNAGLADQNIALLNVNDMTKTVLRTGVDIVAIGTGWARVEAGVHYPSDVLAGAALGNFFAKFFYDAFMGVESGASVYVAPGTAARAPLIGIDIKF